jgi:hypothetical protein
MPLALSLFPDVDGLDGLIDASMPLFALLLWALALGLAITVIGQGVARIRSRSPVDKLLRRRFG